MATQLVPLKDVERLSSRVIRILGGNPGKFTLQGIVLLPENAALGFNVLGSNTYLIGTGPQRILVDTGEGKPSWISSLKETLQAEEASVSEAIITHWHPDHQGGIKHLLEMSPTAKIYKNKPEKGQHNINDGQVFQVSGASLRAIFSPGHTQDHMAFVLEEEDAMLTGDNVLGHGTAVFEDLHTYLTSLERMRGEFAGRVYPGHGAVIEDGPSKILEYIRHRQQREDQVIQVLKSSKSAPEVTVDELDEWTSMEIVKIVYKNVPENLHLPANGGVRQILRKLKEEDKVVENPTTEKWRLKNRAAL